MVRNMAGDYIESSFFMYYLTLDYADVTATNKSSLISNSIIASILSSSHSPHQNRLARRCRADIAQLLSSTVQAVYSLELNNWLAATHSSATQVTKMQFPFIC